MNKHLSDEQFASQLLEGGSVEAREHLAACEACAAEAERLRAALAGFAQQARGAAELPGEFWQRQRAAVQARARAAQSRAAPRWVWAGVAATLALAALLLLGAPRPAPQPAAQEHADELLLLQVQHAVAREVPSALAPASYLVAERNRAAQETDNP